MKIDEHQAILDRAVGGEVIRGLKEIADKAQAVMSQTVNAIEKIRKQYKLEKP